MSEPILFCFSHLRWGFVYQRPQHLLTRAARHFRVLFIEEPHFESGAMPRLDHVADPSGVEVLVPILPEGLDESAVEASQRGLIDRLLLQAKGRPHIFWYYTPMALGFTDHHEPDLCVYDCMDELSAFRFAPAKLKDRERALLRRADLVFTGGQSLYEAKKGQHRNVHAFPSSIDAAHFAQARKPTNDPQDQRHIPHPRLGFFGVIDERMDLDLLREVAELRPDWQFVMIGPVVKIDEAKLPRSANIHWLGGKRYENLPGYLAGWDLGLMPFAINESTRFISPTKTPEFLAAGVPVVSTPIVDVVRSYGAPGLVEIASDAAAVVAKAEALLARPKSPWLEKVDRHLSGLSWDKTWGAMHALMRGQLESARRPAAGAALGNREAAHV
jgi:glycosyltransferase involved in cell wall biosynthesis